MGRPVVAFAVITTGLVVTGAVVRLAQPRDPDALAAAARSLQPDEGGPALIVVIDPTCPACDVAVTELYDLVRPRELGLAVRIVSAEGAGRKLLSATGPGLVPVFVVTDGAGRPVTVFRGPRPAAIIRAWLEESTARALEPRTEGEPP